MQRARCCLLVALALAGCAPSGMQPQPARGRVLADAGGPIELVLVVVSSPRRSPLRNQDLVQRVIENLDPVARALILADPEMVLDPNPRPARISFAEIPEGHHFTIWPQDPFVVLYDADRRPLLLASRDYDRHDDREMAATVGRALHWTVEPSELFFTGGNVLADERHAFVGIDLIRRNATDLELPEEEIIRRFRRELGRPVVVVGRDEQPVEHVDMIITPLGRGRVALADGNLGAAVAATALEQDRRVVRDFEDDAERKFFGHPELRSVVDKEGKVHRAPSISGLTEGAMEDSRRMAASLDAIADDLRGRGYSVLRVPLLMTRLDRPEQLRRPGGSPGYPALTYNNVLVERVATGERVYLPRYGFEALDRAAAAVWERAGFEVRPIDGVTISAMYRGSLRCTVKVLARATD